MNRRTLLALAGATSSALAGCADDPDGLTTEDEPEDESPPTGNEETPADDEETPTDDGATSAEDEETPTDDGDNPIHEGYETTTVTARSAGGERLGAVTAAIADTPELRYLGLSDTPELPSDRGMLFVFDDVADRTFVMREMSFGIDIVYADADGTITRIHHAPAPEPDEDGNEQRYPGRGQYVLEVVRDWTTEHGVNEADVLAFDLPE